MGSGYFINTSVIGSSLIYNTVTENKFGEITYKKIKLNRRLPTPHEMQVFSIGENEYLWHAKRLRLIQGKVTQIEETRLPVRIFKKIDEKIIESSLQKHVISLGLEIDSYLTTYKAIKFSERGCGFIGVYTLKLCNEYHQSGFFKNGRSFCRQRHYGY